LDGGENISSSKNKIFRSEALMDFNKNEEPVSKISLYPPKAIFLFWVIEIVLLGVTFIIWSIKIQESILVPVHFVAQMNITNPPGENFLLASAVSNVKILFQTDDLSEKPSV
jgi:hypothetical protein